MSGAARGDARAAGMRPEIAREVVRGRGNSLPGKRAWMPVQAAGLFL